MLIVFFAPLALAQADAVLLPDPAAASDFFGDTTFGITASAHDGILVLGDWYGNDMSGSLTGFDPVTYAQILLASGTDVGIKASGQLGRSVSAGRDVVLSTTTLGRHGLWLRQPGGPFDLHGTFEQPCTFVGDFLQHCNAAVSETAIIKGDQYSVSFWRFDLDTPDSIVFEASLVAADAVVPLVAIDRDRAVAGAGTGAVQVYERDPVTGWAQTAALGGGATLVGVAVAGDLVLARYWGEVVLYQLDPVTGTWGVHHQFPDVDETTSATLVGDRRVLIGREELGNSPRWARVDVFDREIGGPDGWGLAETLQVARGPSNAALVTGFEDAVLMGGMHRMGDFGEAYAWNRPPTLRPWTLVAGTVAVRQGGCVPVEVDVLSATDAVDPAADLTFAVTSAADHGTFALDGIDVTAFSQADLERGGVSWCQDGADQIRDDVWFRVTDSEGFSSIERSLRVVVDAFPVGFEDAYTVAEDEVLDVSAPGLLTNDSAEATSALPGTSPQSGLLALAADGGFVFEPDGPGVVQFTYLPTNGVDVGDPVTVTVEVTATAAPPDPDPDPLDTGTPPDPVVEPEPADEEPVDGCGCREGPAAPVAAVLVAIAIVGRRRRAHAY